MSDEPPRNPLVRLLAVGVALATALIVGVLRALGEGLARSLGLRKAPPDAEIPHGAPADADTTAPTPLPAGASEPPPR
jgi:hypothetical protein